MCPRLDAFCPDDEDRTFQREDGGHLDEALPPGTRLYFVTFQCARDPNHRIFFDYLVWTDKRLMIKTGQWPSLADLAEAGVKRYRKVLEGRSSRSTDAPWRSRRMASG